jgi:hypothetical protein
MVDWVPEGVSRSSLTLLMANKVVVIDACTAAAAAAISAFARWH